MGRTTIIRVGIGSTSEHVNAYECSNCDAERRQIEQRIKEYHAYIERLRKGRKASISWRKMIDGDTRRQLRERGEMPQWLERNNG